MVEKTKIDRYKVNGSQKKKRTKRPVKIRNWSGEQTFEVGWLVAY